MPSFELCYSEQRASQLALLMKNPPGNAGDVRDTVWSLGWEDPLEEGMATTLVLPGEFHWQILLTKQQ